MIQSSFILDKSSDSCVDFSISQPKADFVRDSRGGEERPGRRTSNLAGCGASCVKHDEACD
jgi:hypothetical protein